MLFGRLLILMKTADNKAKYLILLHGLLLFYSLGGVASKTAASKQLFTAPFLFYYAIVLIVLFVYAIVWQQLLIHLPLTLAYANKAITTIWGMVWGMLFFHEKITWNMIGGALVIIAGIYLVVSGDE